MQKDDVQKIKMFSVFMCAAHFYVLVFKQNTAFVFSTSGSILQLFYVSGLLNSVRSFLCKREDCM